MKNIINFLLPILFLIFYSCESEKIEKVEMEVQYFNEIKVNTDKEDIEKNGSIPDLFEMTKYIIIENTAYVFSPLYVKRIDLSNKIEIDYLNKKGRNFEKIKAIERAHREYFKDGIDFELDDRFKQINQTKIDFDDYVNKHKSKPNYFFIDFNGNLKVDGNDAPSSSEQLAKKIEKYILSNNTNKKKKEETTIEKIIVVVTPNYYKSDFTESDKKLDDTPPTPVKEVEKEKIKSGSGGAIPPQPPPPPTKTEKCNAQLSASSIEDWLYKLTSTSFDDCRKDNLASNYSEFFESNAKVVLVDNIGNPMQTFSSVSSYVSRIRGKNRKIKVDDENSIVNGGRYTKLAVREP